MINLLKIFEKLRGMPNNCFMIFTILSLKYKYYLKHIFVKIMIELNKILIKNFV